MFVDIIKAADLRWLVTDNGQQSYQRLSQTLLWTRAFRAADGGHFEHILREL